MDPFVIYNPVYSLIREEMSIAAYGRDYAALEERTTVRNTAKWVVLMRVVPYTFMVDVGSAAPGVCSTNAECL